MGVEYAVMCETHREALIVSKLGKYWYRSARQANAGKPARQASPGEPGSEVFPFTPEFIPETIPEEEYQKYEPFYERKKELLRSFVERHPACALIIGNDRNSGSWPWGEGPRSLPVIAGARRHPSGWNLFDVFDDIVYVRLEAEHYGKPEILERHVARGATDLAEVLRSQRWDSRGGH